MRAARSALSVVGPALGQEGRQDRPARLRDEGAAPRDDQRVVAGLGQVGEQRPHLGGGPEVMMRRQAPAVVVGDGTPLRDAQQRVVRLVDIAVGEIGVVGRDQRHIVRIGEIDQPGLAARLVRQAVPLQFDVEPAREHVLEARAACAAAASAWPSREQPPDRPAGAAGEADQAVVRGREIGRR